MNKEVQFRRNVYIILLSILLLGILIQVARSPLVLNSYRHDLLQERQALFSDMSRTSPASAQAAADELYCLAYLADDAQSVALKNNVQKTLEYMKQSVRLYDLNKQVVDYEACYGVLLATEHLSAAENVVALEEYVHQGGSVFFLRSLVPDDSFIHLHRKMGIVSFEYMHSTKGIHVTSNVLIGQEGLKTGEEFMFNTANLLALDDESELLAESLENVPLMWRREYGEGSFVVFNGDTLYLKSNRGLIAGGVGLMKPDFMYPVFNLKLFYIDDFPAPIKKGIDASIYKSYKMDTPTFFRQIWWPDMLKAAQKHDIKYSAAVIQSYNDEVKPPFAEPVDEEMHNLIAYGREVLKSGGEMTIHGYNHQSLQMSEQVGKFYGYRVWNRQEDMETSIHEVLSYMKNAFPKYIPMSYVPPSNVLGDEGRAALKKAWPEMAVIASLYDIDSNGMAYVQEFGASPDGIIELPRITSGYFETEYNNWLEANTITSIGVFSHFIHPDDLFDEARSLYLTWDKLYERFTHLLERLDRTYPWLRPITSTEAGLDMAMAAHAQVSIERQADRIEGKVANYKKPLYYVLRTERKITGQDNCSVKKIDDQLYLVTIYNSEFAIGLGR